MLTSQLSLDDTSSLSSESVTTTVTTTSSSLSSSTSGDIIGLTVNQPPVKIVDSVPRSQSGKHSANSHHSSKHKSHFPRNSPQHPVNHNCNSKSTKSTRNGNQSMSNDLNRQSSSTCPSTSHSLGTRSPKKSLNVKKSDSSIHESTSVSGRSIGSIDSGEIHHQHHQHHSHQSRDNSGHSSQVPVWKKYVHEQHIIMKPQTISPAYSSQSGSMGLNKGSTYSSGNKPIYDSHSVSGETPRNSKYSTGKGSSMGLIDSRTLDSPYSIKNSHSSSPMMRANSSATTGRIPNYAKSYSDGLRFRQTGKSSSASSTTGSSPYSYSEGIYSDSEYMSCKRPASSASNYFNGKYSYMTSPVRIRGGSTNPRSAGGTNSCNGSGPSSLPYGSAEIPSDWLTRDSSGYGQILSPWLHRNGFGIQRNEMTSVESMESIGNGLKEAGSKVNDKNIRESSGLTRRSNSVASKLTGNPGDLHSAPSSRLPMTPNRSKLRGSVSILTSSSLGNDLIRKPNDTDSGRYSSALSLVSNATVFSQVDEKYGNMDLRKLKRDLDQANERVVTLTSQLNANAHMVTAFEQSLSSMNARLQQMASMSERKDAELNRLRALINGHPDVASDIIIGSPSKKADKKNKEKKSLLIRRHTFASATTDDLNSHSPRLQYKDSRSIDSECKSPSKSRKDRKYSADSIDSSSGVAIQNSKGWLRSSLTKAFRKSKSSSKGQGSDDLMSPSMGGPSMGENGFSPEEPYSLPNIAMMTLKSYRDLTSEAEKMESEIVDELKQQLREKEKALTDLRLEALTAAHQLDSFKEIVNKMRGEMMSLKQDNDRLQRMVITKSLASSKSSVLSGSGSGGTNGLSSNGDSHQPNSHGSIKLADLDESLLEGGRKVSLLLDPPSIGGNGKVDGCLLIGTVIVSPETTWGILDALVRKTVQDYLDRVDSDRNLGLSLDSISYYEVGSERQLRNLRPASSSSSPELLPFGYIVNELSIKLGVRSYLESFVFETLIPKNIIQRLVSLLHEHKRLILYGPSGTGKTYLASKLAEYLVVKIQKGDRTSKGTNDSEDENTVDLVPSGSISTFNVDDKSESELKSFLTSFGEQFETSSEDSNELPVVIILDNLHHVTSIDDLFKGNATYNNTNAPFTIATISRSSSCSPSPPLNHTFRWFLCANHMEPVRGFLSRYLQRKLVTSELNFGSIDLTIPTNLISIVEWIPKVWNHINHFLEVHHSSDVTLGPSLFITCPMDLEASQVWFNDLWNYSIHPYLITAARDGLQKNGLRSPFEDPTDWIKKTYPWRQSSLHSLEPGTTSASESGFEDKQQFTGSISLKSITLEDIQPYPGLTISSPISDPLSDMLLRLQVASNTSSGTDGNGLSIPSQNSKEVNSS